MKLLNIQLSNVQLSTFQGDLTSKISLMTSEINDVNKREQQLMRQLASLSTLSETAQANHLEEMLNNLSVAYIDDAIRLRLLAIVMMSIESFIATLRKLYIYEVGALSHQQLETVSQVESLYYLALMNFDAIIQRESLILHYQQQQMVKPSFWQRMTTPQPELPITLAVAIHQALTIYQNLLYERAICYQNPLRNMWLSLNQLYYLACEYNITELNLTPNLATHEASTIHQLYCQMCLHSLLNVVTMDRPSMLLIQRVLPKWSAHIVATLEPQTKTRIFIDLNNDAPPQYLTATIDPYEDKHDCLFIELEPLAVYLKQRQHELLAQDNALDEYQLVTKILMAITHRYIAREPTS